MQKNIFLSMFIVIAILTIALQGFSAETKAKTKAKTKGKTSAVSTQENFNITGDITRINLKDSALTVSTKTNTSLTFIVNKNTGISRSGKSLKIPDIKNGDSVDIAYEKKGGKNIAKYIYIHEKYTTYPMKSKSR